MSSDQKAEVAQYVDGKSWWRKLFTLKNVDNLRSRAESSEMSRSLSAFDLTAIGVGAIIGTGIFVLTGTAAAQNAGPAVVLSFAVAGVAAGTAAMAYSEMACMIPVSGSAYTYSYATMGELVGWIIGWDLILEYLVGAATVSVGWSGYFVKFCESAFNWQLDKRWVDSPVIFDAKTNSFEVTGNYINLPASVVSLVVTGLLCFGIRESARANAVMVCIKTLVILLFIFACIKYVEPSNYTPFVPENEGSFSKYGATGVLAGATRVFFSYIGFDAVSTAAQEAKNPQRDLPIGICSSLILCTILYVAVCVVMTGVVPFRELNSSAPINVVIGYTGMRWLGIIVSLGILFGLTSVMLVLLIAQPRIFYSMALDGLFPKFAAKLHPKYKTPWSTTLISGLFCAVAGGVLPVDVLGEMTSVGTLFAFALVNIGVTILRVKRPDLPRKFKVPLGPYLFPGLGAIMSVGLIATASAHTLLRLFVWMGLGVLIYFCYGRTHSVINNPHRAAEFHDIEKVDI
ncbi:amino acid/polyamine/organocation transporter, APC superfamily [Basidiobolus meristosporus CBS 931.73]|uniref:Amino acid/polyamine/organocation transporter, APC superfamily n=1 Tax=Basidiobolus meristosporus CBS 931.73 TaxID=1314790 RepID=A0A1Y1WW03_9FUNG|nr:amino acid/polyamine/organocation transporter, APC superfamily [Basidiobolus meristosporus CBS 931.73]|eukprot:ORX77575.1 amino acid/polyamine/organocation transporter, APC superfamily [Basidiobolus meristosporus CBS 931.73]